MSDTNPMSIVWLAAVRWDFALVGRTRMLTECWLGRGLDVHFVEVPALRTALRRLLDGPVDRRQPHVLRPAVLPPPHCWWLLGRERIECFARGRARELRRRLDARIDWSRSVGLVVSPVWTPWLDELPFARVVYDCIDDVRVQTPRRRLGALYRAWEHQLVTRCDGLIASASVLLERARRLRPDLPGVVVPNGVDAGWFARQAAALPRPADLPAGPIVGFVGALYSWIDWALIHRVATTLPHVAFVFVGPTLRRGVPDRVRSLPNTYWLGPRPYVQVPAYVAAFDVCWLPFRDDAISRAANPIKLYEYLALGKPVVSTPVADPDGFRGLVQFAHEADTLARLLRQALEAPCPDAAARQAFARENAWQARAGQIETFLCGLLEAGRRADLEAERVATPLAAGHPGVRQSWLGSRDR